MQEMFKQRATFTDKLLRRVAFDRSFHLQLFELTSRSIHFTHPLAIANI